MSALSTDTRKAGAHSSGLLPGGFVYLRDLAPAIEQDMRYATNNNFTGSIVPGYLANECILRIQAARALNRVQSELEQQGLGLRIYDGYRPVAAVRAFVMWARQRAKKSEKLRYYPGLGKHQLIGKGYIATRSAHSRGNTVDLTLVRSGHQSPPSSRFNRIVRGEWVFIDGSAMAAANREKTSTDRHLPEMSGRRGGPALPGQAKSDDDSLFMGTAFDCFDALTHTKHPGNGGEARANRQLLVRMMRKHGFANFHKEWWHFTYHERATPRKHYNFFIHPRP